MTYTKRNLPHLYFKYGMYFITFRLMDSLPKNVLTEFRNMKIDLSDDNTKRLFKKYDDILDSGKWSQNYLNNENVSSEVKYCLHYPDGKEYKLICYTIMSNHVHVVFDLLENNKGLNKIMQSVKGISARKANKVLNQTGKFWQDESYDRLIRNENEFNRIIYYVLMNPVKAGLVENWMDWKNSYCHPDFIEFVK